MDYEEALLQVTDVLKANNRYRLGDFEQAVKLIRDIVTPKGKWVFDSEFPMFGSPYGSYKCSCCGMHTDDEEDNYCWFCGARMESDV